MKFNKGNKAFIVVSLVAILGFDLNAARPGLYNNPDVPTNLPISGVAVNPAVSSKSLGGMRPARNKRFRHRRSHASTQRTGTICRRSGCNKAKVIGKVSRTGASNAIACRGSVCRRAVVRRASTGRGGRVYRRGGANVGRRSFA